MRTTLSALLVAVSIATIHCGNAEKLLGTDRSDMRPRSGSSSAFPEMLLRLRFRVKCSLSGPHRFHRWKNAEIG